uniref:Uncharacterized protein n=1 Tax=Acrobeloides nanus TaxID=290746 RepID=A0A914EAR8_9BILA
MLHRMDIVIDSKLCKDLNFRSDNDVLKWNTKMIFVKLVDVQHLSDVNKILLALYEREHSGIGQVVEVHQN